MLALLLSSLFTATVVAATFTGDAPVGEVLAAVTAQLGLAPTVGLQWAAVIMSRGINTFADLAVQCQGSGAAAAAAGLVAPLTDHVPPLALLTAAAVLLGFVKHAPRQRAESQALRASPRHPSRSKRWIALCATRFSRTAAAVSGEW